METISPNTLFTGKRFIYLHEIDSTNNHAVQLLQRENLPEGTVIFTPSQVKGRGQFGNEWLSEPGKNIAMSVILYPNFLQAEKQFFLNQAVSLAVFDFCKKTVMLPDKLKIKWSNDIFIGDKKAGGILVENTLSGNRINNSVVGIGINVNQTRFPAEIPDATSLKSVTGNSFPLLNLVEKLCEELEFRYLQLREGKHDLLKRDYLQVLYRYQEIHSYKISHEVVAGQILGVTEDGKLIIEMNGRLNYFGFKEIEFL